MKKRVGHTLADKLAENRRAAAEAAPPEEARPQRERRSFVRQFQRRGAGPEKPAVHLTPRPAGRESAGRGRLAAFALEVGGILQEIAPGLLTKFRDWRRRRRVVRSYLRSRPKRADQPAQGGAGNEPAAGVPAPAKHERPARALPKLSAPMARRARIAAWRVARPVFHWHHRSPPGLVLGVYFGVLLLVSVTASACLLVSSNGKPPAPAAAGKPAEVGLGLANSPAKILSVRVTPEISARLQGEADNAFRAGRFADAEARYRESLPAARFPALTGFHVFLCLLKQGKVAEAKALAGKFPEPSSIRNPSGAFVHAAIALAESRPDDARLDIDSARRRFPMISPFYEKALSDAALAPAR